MSEMNVTVGITKLLSRLVRVALFGLAAAPSTAFAQGAARPRPDVDRRSDEHRDHVGVAEGTARRGRRRGGLRDHPRRHSPLRHDDDPRPAPAGAWRRGRADQLEQMGRVGARVQRLVREQAARPRRRPQRLQPDLLGRALGRRGPDARRHRSDRGDSRSRRRHVGRERRERRDQHRHQSRGRHAGRRSSASTAGALANRAPSATAGPLGAASYRLYSQWTGRDQSLIAPGTRANDASHSVTTGFRADWTTAAWRVHGGGRLHGGPGARAVAQPRPADGRARTDRERSLRFAGRPSPGPLDAHARQRRVAADPVVRRHRGPAGAGRATTTGMPSTSTRNTTRRSVRIRIWSPAPATGSSTRRSRDASAFR